MQTAIKTINSQSITWFIMQGGEGEDFKKAYCADGDGILQVVEQLDGSLVILDQLDPVKTFEAFKLYEALHAAEQYLAATYHEIYQEALHNESPFEHLNNPEYWETPEKLTQIRARLFELSKRNLASDRQEFADLSALEAKLSEKLGM